MSRFIYPTDAPLSQGFGANPDYYKQFGENGHNGLDFAAAIGTPVKASADGVVFFEGDGSATSWMGSIAGYCIILDHGDIYTGYAHLSSTIIDKGQSVKQGQVIGYSGRSGTATGPHLHFEFIAKPFFFGNGYGGRVDPKNYLTQGDDMATVNKGDVVNMYQLILGRDPEDGAYATYVGMDWKAFTYSLTQSDEYKKRIQGFQATTAQRDELTRQRDQDLYPMIERQKGQIETLSAQMVELQAQVEDLTKKLQIAKAGNGDATKWQTLGLLLKQLLGLNK